MTEAEQPEKQNRWRRRLIDVAVIALIFFAVRAYQQRDVATGPAPELLGTSASDGVAINLATYRGAPVAVHFWASWCGVCEAVRGNVGAVAEDLPVLTVATQSGNVAVVGRFLNDSPIGAPVLVDERGVLARRYGVKAFPTTFILDGEGQIRHVEVGYTSEFGLRARMWLAGL